MSNDINLKVIKKVPEAYKYSVWTYLVDALPGEGKTQVLTAIGFHEWLFNNRVIASTYPLKYRHRLIKTQEDILKLKNCVFLADEIWRTLFSRTAMKKDQQEILAEFTENIRKRNILMYCTTHRVGNIDVMLREGIFTHRIVPIKVMLVTPNEDILRECETPQFSFKTLNDTAKAMLSTPENTGILLKVYDRYGYFYSSWTIKDLSFYGNMFKTWHEIGRITNKKVAEGESERPGFKLEYDLYKKFERHGYGYVTDLLKNSGQMSSKPGDIIALKTLIDVKGILKRKSRGYAYECIDIRSHPITDYLKCTDLFELKCFFAIKKNGWKFIPITEDSSFIENQTSVNVNELQPQLNFNQFCREHLPIEKKFAG